MSDFWDKNKGSITSGLKSAGKYGYQGTKYVAKTGYKAGKKNFNSKKKNDKAKKNKDSEEEDDSEDERDTRHHSYHNQYRDPSTLPPPPVRGVPGQVQYQQPQFQQPQYQQPQYQQPQYQQPQYQQPQYQQPQYQQPQYQQPQVQQPPYQQPQYQQPQYQQPQYQQPQYQQPQYQQPQYQQPQYQQPQVQQPQYQQPQVQQPQVQQPQYQPAPVQAPQYQESPQPVGPVSPALQPPLATNQPPAPPSRQSSGQNIQPALPGAPMPGLAALPAQSEVIPPAPVPIRSSMMVPNAVSQTAGASMATTPQGSIAPGIEHQPVQDPMSPSGIAGQGYTRARLNSPPPLGGAVYAESVSTGSSGTAPEKSVPGVTPYEYGNLEARRLASRLTSSPVDLNSLPPPPTHKDRSTPDLVSSNSKAQTSEQDRQMVVSRNTDSAAAESVGRASPISSALPPASPAKQPVAPALPKRVSQTTTNVSQVEPIIETSNLADNDEEETRGIAGKFNYDVKLDYAPPPRPHRDVPDTKSKPSIPRKPSIPKQNVSGFGAPTSAARPMLPNRQSTEPAAGSATNPASSGRTFEPPPKPFRRTESESTQRSSYSARSSVRVINDGDVKASMQDVSSFPLPPLRSRPSTQSFVSAHDVDDNDRLQIHPRGRLIPSVPLADQDESTNKSTGSVTGKKKAPPPTVKPKPKGLLSRASTTENLESMVPEHSDPPGISAITQELSHVHLRKTGFTLGSEPEHHSSDPGLTTKKTPPPMVPRKKETLKHAPPVPMKSSSLRSKSNGHEETDAADRGNPFELYLKDVVPSEENRFHH